MKKIVLMIGLVALGIPHTKAQSPIQQQIDATSPDLFVKAKMFSVIPANTNQAATLKEYVSRFTLLQVDENILKQLARMKEDALEIDIPFENTITTVQLIRSNVIDAQTVFTSQSGQGKQPLTYTPGAYYYGVIKNQPHTVVAISFFDDNIIGVIANDNGNYVLGKRNTSDTQSNEYLIYNDKDLLIPNTFACGTDTRPNEIPILPSMPETLTAAGDHCVKVYIETDQQIFINQGRNTNSVLNFVTGLFNVVRTLYQNESINTSISQVNVWITPDPYIGLTKTEDVLPAFSNAMNGGFNGDLAHLLSASYNDGGRGYINSLCSTASDRVAVSSGLQNTTSPFPTYSRGVKVVTHEIGHNLGSKHTHDCVWMWNGKKNNALDGCGPALGCGFGCDANPDGCSMPALPLHGWYGGTIMSYCDLLTRSHGIGIGFSYGFGQQPGDRIRDNVYGATCLASCCPDNVTITGLYNQLFTESQTWIKSSGQTTIPNTANVRLDADPASGYVDLYPTAATDFFLAAPIGDGVFIAHPFDGCGTGIPTFAPDRLAAAKLLGKNEMKEIPSLTIYPNPTTESFTLTYGTEDITHATIQVTTILGDIEPVSIKEIDAQTKEITFTKPKPGIYLLLLHTNNLTERKLIIIE